MPRPGCVGLTKDPDVKFKSLFWAEEYSVAEAGLGMVIPGLRYCEEVSMPMIGAQG
jgi:hypothetical protein